MEFQHKEQLRDDDVQMFEELYDCEWWRETQQTINRHAGDQSGRILAILLASDSTMLANYGTASSWNLFISLGIVYDSSQETSQSTSVAKIPTTVCRF
jgi:hypothetical protein